MTSNPTYRQTVEAEVGKLRFAIDRAEAWGMDPDIISHFMGELETHKLELEALEVGV